MRNAGQLHRNGEALQRANQRFRALHVLRVIAGGVLLHRLAGLHQVDRREIVFVVHGEVLHVGQLGRGNVLRLRRGPIILFKVGRLRLGRDALLRLRFDFLFLHAGRGGDIRVKAGRAALRGRFGRRRAGAHGLAHGKQLVGGKLLFLSLRLRLRSLLFRVVVQAIGQHRLRLARMIAQRVLHIIRIALFGGLVAHGFHQVDFFDFDFGLLRRRLRDGLHNRLLRAARGLARGTLGIGGRAVTVLAGGVHLGNGLFISGRAHRVTRAARRRGTAWECGWARPCRRCPR